MKISAYESDIIRRAQDHEDARIARLATVLDWIVTRIPVEQPIEPLDEYVTRRVLGKAVGEIEEAIGNLEERIGVQHQKKIEVVDTRPKPTPFQLKGVVSDAITQRYGPNYAADRPTLLVLPDTYDVAEPHTLIGRRCRIVFED